MKAYYLRLAAMCLMAAAWPAAGQDNTGYTSVALFKVKADGAGAFAENMKKFIVPLGTKLIQEGTIGGYGVDLDLFHQQGGPNAALWMDVASFAEFGKVSEALEAAMKASPQLVTATLGSTDTTAHADLMLRHLFVNMKKPPVGSLPFTNFYSLKVKPGRMSEFTQLFEKYQKPSYDKMVADGVIHGYSVDTEAIHSSEAGTVWILAVMPDLAAKDKMLAVAQALPDRRAAQVAMNAVMVEGSHRDNISKAVVFAVK